MDRRIELEVLVIIGKIPHLSHVDESVFLCYFLSDFYSSLDLYSPAVRVDLVFVMVQKCVRGDDKQQDKREQCTPRENHNRIVNR